MPRPKNQVPTYRLHKQSGQAIVTVTSGGVRKDITLGRHGSEESKAEYRRVLADLASGRIGTVEARDLTVTELCLKFWTWAEGYYRTAEDGPSNELQNHKHAIIPFRQLYGALLRNSSNRVISVSPTPKSYQTVRAVSGCQNSGSILSSCSS